MRRVLIAPTQSGGGPDGSGFESRISAYRSNDCSSIFMVVPHDNVNPSLSLADIGTATMNTMPIDTAITPMTAKNQHSAHVALPRVMSGIVTVT
ncbi:hypothetical protein [Mycolicibacterium helvum]|uniref:hypothetical protein n=1 Tax=Mycolicibacterium helvum TaxID=1534349 RepID=UPI0013D2DCD1|nr:hypothetical protein [Mycolicibacterium helvum]